ncbi:ATP-dependent DNA ligase [Ramlibacter ginsenosidimutans]|uniref:DNA ligase (ATP) n=1 Tax=Ramlibacter ginsenosidimutans TaxID=502333 RepID=A0A934TXK7_9BURK|nr:ATP-dependent DNA ligase [Ramlibacter ginsenosidimutans]MBK6009524.1 ATP-dependent DNA ligase [Ramlibacter ginsenosidimutans]
MKRFARLFSELDATTSTNEKVEALTRYFAEAPSRDAAWAVYFLAGGKPRQVVKTASLVGLACHLAQIDYWLFDECYQAVGDLAETIALVLPRGDEPSDVGLAEWVEDRLLPLRGLPDEEVAKRVGQYWWELDALGRFLLTKLVGGGFRVGVSKLLVQRALAAHAGIDAKRVAQRMMGYTDGKTMPSPERYEQLVAQAEEGVPEQRDAGQPYPFFLAHQLDAPPELFAARLGPVDEWMVEWKYDGIRGQVVKRAGRVWIWSRGEELVTERFPEIEALAQSLPDGTVLDGEILVWSEETDPETGEVRGRPAPFALLQQRIGRKNLTKKILAEAPVSFMAYDLLEQDGEDLRGRTQQERRTRLESLLQPTAFKVSPVETAASWLEFASRRERSRDLGVEGFMLKRLDAAYGTGRTKAEGLWWKWKIDPMSVDCVLVYAQPGHGRRSSVYTDYTFAVWNRAPASKEEADAVVEAIARKEPPQPDALQLVPFAKAYSGLTDEEFRKVDALIRRHTVEKFGPVRSVKPMLVFELGFEGINRSGRHRSGIAVRFPRMLRIREDKPLHEANTLQDLEVLLGL